tara:strand:+ start:26255 stop:32977 length:6723 start_codon:yes stop_codon:yes gene_type:complete
MAKSKFLKLQDKNGDRLIDTCDEQPIVPKLKKCPDCVPNSSAIVPNWKKQKNNEPWKNEKECLYQVTITTSETSTTDPAAPANEKKANEFMEAMFAANKATAIASLLVNFDKKVSTEAKTTLDAIIEYTKFDLGVRQNARVKLLYSVPADDFDALEDDDGSEEEKDDSAGSDITVTFKAGTMALKMIKIRKALKLYNRYVKVAGFIDKTTFVEKATGAVFSFDDFGDAGVWGDSVTSKILPELDLFLNKKGFDIPKSSSSEFGSSLWKKDLSKLRITFSSKYKIKKIEAFVAGCKDPTVFKGTKVDGLSKKAGFNSPTAMAYFAQMDEMERGLTSRTPMPWVDFLLKFTYPALEEKVDWRSEKQEGDPTALTCVADALKKEGKQLGLDILGEGFGLGDAIAMQFHETVCKESAEEASEEKAYMGLEMDWSKEARNSRQKERQTKRTQRREARPGKKEEARKRREKYWSEEEKLNRGDKRTESRQALMAMAKEQAFADLDMDTFSFEKLCATFIMGGGFGSFSVDDVFRSFIGPMKLCGFQGLLQETIRCLMGGLTLEQALSKIAKAALSEMSLDNFGILFIGLPPEQQLRIENLAKQKIESGDLFKDSSQNQKLSDQIGGGKAMDMSLPVTAERGREDRTIAEQFDITTAKERLRSDIIFEAYIQALLDEYGDNLLDLVDKLNEFPGAPLVATIISALDCPTGPIFDPSVMDWIKDVELPFCRNKDDINVKLVNPFGWYPGNADISAALFEAVKKNIKTAILEIMIKVLQKTCQIFGDAICKSLSVMGDLAVGALTGNNTFADMVRDSICGDNADDEAVQKATEDIVKSLGPGGAAFANEEDAMQWTQDVSSATTQDEMAGAFLGDCSDEFLTIVDTIIEYEYPQYRDSLPNKEAICRFFTNVGNLMPADFRNQMKSNLEQTDKENEMQPANPSLCITDEQQQEFCELRAQLLEGRATPEQIREMCDNIQEEIAEDLETTTAMAQGDPFDPGPIVSDPGCDNGLIPFESDEAVKSVSMGLADALEQLKMDYVDDMIGNGGWGPFTDSSDWGMLNMILADTSGSPLTVHNKRANRRFGPTMDYITHEPIGLGDIAGGVGAALSTMNPLALLLLTIKPMPTLLQNGATPIRVAGWLEDSLNLNYSLMDMAPLWGDFVSTNDWEKPEAESISFKDLFGLFGEAPTAGVDLTRIPDKGYNTEFRPSWEELGGDDSVTIIRRGRKLTPDLRFRYRDNCKDREQDSNPTWERGFNIELYLSDLEENKQDRIRNVPSNNSRIIINDAVNVHAPGDLPSPLASAGVWAVNPMLGVLSAAKDVRDAIRYAADKTKAPLEVIEMQYEFFAHDDTLDGIRLERNRYAEYPKLLTAFQSYNDDYPPQLFLLQELIEKENPDAEINIVDLKTRYDDINDRLVGDIRNLIASNTNAFKYGASFDDLTTEDFDYVMPYDSDFSEPQEYEYDRLIKTLGISRNQWNMENAGTPELTRIFYLNPMTHGKFLDSFKSPPVYVKALDIEGWLGFINAVFPDFSECPNAETDFVDFGVIEDRVDESYPRIPEDQRLKDGPDCAVELPYNRILERASKSGLEAVISATLQIFISTHLIKGMPVFTLFKPSVPDNYSKIYVSYLVEVIERALRDAQGPLREAFNTFKDNEFWYAFLEQSVQLYDRLTEDGQIVDVPWRIQEAITRLDDMQEAYKYPGKEELRRAIKLGDEPWYQIFNLPGFRTEKNLEAVQATEEDAKLILGELVAREISLMAEKYTDNLKMIGNEPRYSKLGYWLLSELVNGGEGLNLEGTFKESIEGTDLETRTEPFYTNGGELYVESVLDPESIFAAGDDYVGYYHTNVGDDGEKMFMVGKEHIAVAHDVLGVYVNQIKVSDGTGTHIGDIDDYDSLVSSTGNKFIIRKYISIDGEKMSTSAGLARVQQEDAASNLSDHWPGSLEVLTEPAPGTTPGESGGVVGAAPTAPRATQAERDIGLKGKFGVRHGLEFSYAPDHNSNQTLVLTNVEIDALDTSIKDFTIAEPSSKLLLCLINKLLEDLRFRMVTEFIFPINKYTAMSAIYTDMALLPSIGEIVYSPTATGDPDDPVKQPTIDGATDEWHTQTGKPGMHFDTSGFIDAFNDNDGDLSKLNISDYYGGNDGWRSYFFRRPRMGVLAGEAEWDSWDQDILRKSRNRLKQLFKTYYYSRNFKPGDRLTDERPSRSKVRMLKSFYLPQAGANVIPSLKRGKFRPKPFGKQWKICKKLDE